MSKNALITGSSHGIGAAAAIALAKEGYNVGITYCKNPEGAQQIQTQCLAHGVKAKIYGADFQVREDCERFGFLSAFLLCLGADVLIVCDDTAVECRIGDLTDTGRKGIADRFKAGVPIAGVMYQRIGRGYLQKRERHLIADGIVCTCIVLHHAIVQYRLGYGLYHIAVVVRTAKAFSNERRGRYHDYVGQVRKVYIT